MIGRMKRLSRLLAVWCLLLALPLQGIAAALTLACVTGHAPLASAHSRGDASAVHAGSMHRTTDVTATDHLRPAHHEPAIADPFLRGERADPSAGQDTHHPSGSTCSACAACCLMMHALPAGFDFAAARASHGRVVPPAAAAPPSHLPDGLERPPRRTLAV